MKPYKYRVDGGKRKAASIILPLIGSQKRVLEIGCSVGSQTRVLTSELLCDVTAIEIDAKSAESARPYCKRLIIGDIESLDLDSLLGEQEFDVILLADVLEHLRDPGSVLSRLRSRVAPSGSLVCCVPNIGHAAVAWEITHGRFNYQRYGLLDDTHIRFFTRKTIEELLQGSGYSISELHRFELSTDETEFQVVPSSEEDQQFLRYLSKNNAEAETYQFIIKAQPLSHFAQMLTPKLLKLENDNAELLSRLTSADTKIKKLTSEIEWLKNGRQFGGLRSLLRKFGGGQ